MFADLGAKVISPPFVNNLKGRVLWIDFHFTHRIDFKLLPGRIKFPHIKTIRDTSSLLLAHRMKNKSERSIRFEFPSITHGNYLTAENPTR